MSETQLICDSQPFCLCVGRVNEWDECDCTGGIEGCNDKVCEACGAKLIRIDFETGDEVEA